MSSPMGAPQALSYKLPIGHEPLNRLVSEISSLKVRTNRQTDIDTSTDKKGRLKLAAREPISHQSGWSGRCVYIRMQRRSDWWLHDVNSILHASHTVHAKQYTAQLFIIIIMNKQITTNAW